MKRFVYANPIDLDGDQVAIIAFIAVDIRDLCLEYSLMFATPPKV